MIIFDKKWLEKMKQIYDMWSLKLETKSMVFLYVAVRVLVITREGIEMLIINCLLSQTLELRRRLVTNDSLYGGCDVITVYQSS
jgi:hypothetical protein